jgi:hypothetical protein
MIPGGYTSKPQAMDLGINKHFKDLLTEKYDKWFVEVNIRASNPNWSDMAKWVVNTWYNNIINKMIYTA